MSYSLYVYQATLNGSSGYSQLNAISDQAFSVQNNRYLLDDAHQVLWCYGQGATMDRFRLVAPSLRKVFTPTIRAINATSTATSNPNLYTALDHSITLEKGEELQVDVANGGSEATYVGIAVSKNYQPVPRGPVYWTRCTGTTALVANTLTSVPLVFDDTFGTGVFAVVAMECISTNGVFARLIFSGSGDRPGVVMSPTVGTRTDRYIQEASFGIFGVFTNQTLPRLEVLSRSTEAVETLYLGIMKIG